MPIVCCEVRYGRSCTIFQGANGSVSASCCCWSEGRPLLCGCNAPGGSKHVFLAIFSIFKERTISSSSIQQPRQHSSRLPHLCSPQKCTRLADLQWCASWTAAAHRPRSGPAAVEFLQVNRRRAINLVRLRLEKGDHFSRLRLPCADAGGSINLESKSRPWRL